MYYLDSSLAISHSSLFSLSLMLVATFRALKVDLISSYLSVTLNILCINIDGDSRDICRTTRDL